MNDEGAHVLAEERKTRVSLAVKLVDAVTGGRPLVETPVRLGGAAESDVRRGPTAFPRVSLVGTDEAPVENPSGYHLFLDAVKREGQFTVDVAGGERYRDDSFAVTLSPTDTITRRVRLVPTAKYPFPANSALLRGLVRLADESPATGAAVSVRSLGPPTLADERGAFDLRITADEVRWEGDEQVLKVNGDDPVLQVERDDSEFDGVPIRVEQGRVHAYEVTLQADGTMTVQETDS